MWGRVLLVLASAAIGAAAFAATTRRTPPPPAPVARFALTLPPGQQLTLPRQAVAISPDGTRIVYAADGRLYLRPLLVARSDRDRRHRGRAQPHVLA